MSRSDALLQPAGDIGQKAGDRLVGFEVTEDRWEELRRESHDVGSGETRMLDIEYVADAPGDDFRLRIGRRQQAGRLGDDVNGVEIGFLKRLDGKQGRALLLVAFQSAVADTVVEETYVPRAGRRGGQRLHR